MEQLIRCQLLEVYQGTWFQGHGQLQPMGQDGVQQLLQPSVVGHQPALLLVAEHPQQPQLFFTTTQLPTWHESTQAML